MKRILHIVFLLFSVLAVSAENRGIPFMCNYSSTEYNAHNRNFDVACDDYGTVYFANFECLLYYDGSTWRKIYSPGVNRFTRVVWEKHRRKIFVGGYHFFGYLEPDKRGRLQLKVIPSNVGEVDKIELHGKEIYVHDTDDHVYLLDGMQKLRPYRGNTSFIETNMSKVSLGHTRGIHIQWIDGKGIEISDATRHRLLDANDGLCSNSINFIMYDRAHTVWGATNEGIFAIEIPSPFSRITQSQGLQGEVYSINDLGNTIYVGTLQGLYRIDNGKVTQLPGMNTACWQLTTDLINTKEPSLLASTSKGLFRITAGGIHQIDNDYVLAAIPAPHGGIYSSTIDGVYYTNPDDSWITITDDVQKGSRMWITNNILTVETVNGQKYEIDLKPVKNKSGELRYNVSCVRSNIDVNEPKTEFANPFGAKWETDATGHNLRFLPSDNKRHSKLYDVVGKWIRPFTSRTINAIYCTKENSLWVGGDFGIINCDLSLIKGIKSNAHDEPIYIRQVSLNDSVIWGGYTSDGYKPLVNLDLTDNDLPSDSHDLKVFFSSRYQSYVSPTLYSYRTKNGHLDDWSAWSTQSSTTYVLFHNLQYGDTEMEIKAIDLFGNATYATVSWHVDYPFYMQWWAFVVYFIILASIGRAITRYRMKKLERDKEHLEEAVDKATSELKEMQAELVRAERSATAGKLTQGLIDRILNPLNYINNFSKLTSGLAKDLTADIEDEKENMSEDNYEDCEDILDMMNQNLSKIEEHGVNTTRTLRAMEALLNRQTGTLRPTDLTALCTQVAEVTAENYKTLIDKYGITFSTDIAEDVTHDADPEAVTNMLKALLSNAFYAVEKRLRLAPYDNPEVKLSLSCNMLHDKGSQLSSLTICIHDNGIGIEDTIKDKIFDPFFTTKPTNEAAGVGLYLVREVVQDHKGTIAINSEKETFTDVVITL